jgi:hypothetical protein
MLLDEAANRLDAVRRRVSTSGLGPATQAGAVSGLLGLFRAQKESHVLAPRAASRTRGPAIHSSGRYGEYETAILTGITRGERVPAGFFRGRRVGLRDWHFVRDCCCEYRIAVHGKESVRHNRFSGLSETCGQTEICSGRAGARAFSRLRGARVCVQVAKSLDFSGMI